jgi:sulfite reductase (NADPH) flavoprotein alpha-component
LSIPRCDGGVAPASSAVITPAIEQTAPSRSVLDRAMATNHALGHENLGFLSEEHGFAPSDPPLLSLPPSHRAWDDIVGQLPDLSRTLRLREAFDAMPLLPVDVQNLPDAYLCRASALLSMFAHAYFRGGGSPPAELPACIRQPWEEVTRRLRRPEPFLSYIDLIVYNWRLRDPTLADPMRVENMDLLIPTVGNQEERVFHLTQVEILAQCAPVVGAVVRAQEAVTRADVASLERELRGILERFQHVTEVSFQKISPNPRSSTFVDPVVWAKTVAPFAVPIKAGVQGPSGTSAPIFHLMDAFLGRATYDSLLGTEAMRIRAWYPQHWRDFLDAVGKISVRDFVAGHGDHVLEGVFQNLVDGYAGDKGFLGVHRLKVYGYLETAFKMGRSVTIGGFNGLFKDREWNRVDGELDVTRNERYLELERHAFYARPILRDPEVSPAEGAVSSITLDAMGTGFVYQPGDRCAVLPENDDELVDRTLRALRASGEESINLDRVWQQAVRPRSGQGAPQSLPLATFLRYGKIRPVMREVAKALHALTASSHLREILNARAENQWELWDLLDLLYEAGFDTRRLWKAQPWEAESICRIVPPEPFRLYSISSAMEDPAAGSARTVQLTVARLEYATRDSPTSRAAKRLGTASNFLARVATEPAKAYDEIFLKRVPAPRFHLPADPGRPIVMFAAGAGISPFLGFLQERARQANAAENWLFFGTRTRHELYGRQALEEAVEQRRLWLQVAFSAEDTTLRCIQTGQERKLIFESGRRRHVDGLIEEPETANALWDLLRPRNEGGRGALFYVCGRTGFASTVWKSLERLVSQFSPGPDDASREEQSRETLYQLVADGRYLQDIFTTYSGGLEPGTTLYNASDVVVHGGGAREPWLVIDGQVYDMTEFAHLHPGGNKLITAYSGLDATDAYRRVLHHVNTEVDAMLGMYQIGAIRRLDFRGAWGVAIGPKGLFHLSVEDLFRTWVRYLYLVVEMENALANDFSFLDRATTRSEEPGDLTPLKLQLVADVHARFLAVYLDGLTGDDLQMLWAITSGACGPDQDIRQLRQEIAAVNGSDDARIVRSFAESMQTMIGDLATGTGTAGDAGDELEKLRDMCSVLEDWDRRFLREIKMALREGTMVFEEFEGDAVQAGQERLMASILRIPRILRYYYTGVASRIGPAKGDDRVDAPDGAEDSDSMATLAEPALSAAPTSCVRCGTAAEPRAVTCRCCGASLLGSPSGRDVFVGHGM